jgi:hypothetical protein
VQKSETIGKLAEALSAAQKDIQGAVRESTNPFFKSKYADLASVWNACRVALTKNGLSVAQTTSATTEQGIPVETMLMHSSGEWIAGTLTVQPVKNDPQAMGSAITYARRYALAAIVGVAPEDDDGNAASRSDVATSESAQPNAPLPPNQPPKLAVPPSSLKDQFNKAGVKVPTALPIGEGVITFTETKTTKGAKPRTYFSVTQNGNKLACWESKQPHLLRAELWTALSDAKGKYAKLIVVADQDKKDVSKVWHNIVGILKAGDKEWLDDGTPVIQRQSSKPDDPFGATLLEPGTDRDEETGLPI